MENMPSEDIDPYEYENNDPDCIGAKMSGDVCPNCGKCLAYDDPAVREDGERGDVMDLAPEDVSQNIWCKACWHKVEHLVKKERNQTLDQF
jgi:hypothetical protein